MKYLKVFVAVYIYTDAEGNSVPSSIVWEDGSIYKIDKVTGVRDAPPEHVGGLVTKRYDIVVEGKPKILYYETYINRWFVEKPCSN